MRSIPKGIRLFCEDFQKFESRIPDNSIDLLVTLPLHYQQSVWSQFAFMVFAKRVLKENSGILISRATHYELDRVITIAKQAELDYKWMIGKINPTHYEPSSLECISSRFEPLLVFSKDIVYTRPTGLERAPDFIMIEEATKGPTEVAAEFIVKNFSRENDIICDPIMGYGATAFAATKLRRQFVGLEKDAGQFDYILNKFRVLSEGVNAALTA